MARLYSIIESPTHPDASAGYRRLGLEHQVFRSVRKAIAALKRVDLRSRAAVTHPDIDLIGMAVLATRISRLRFHGEVIRAVFRGGHAAIGNAKGALINQVMAVAPVEDVDVIAQTATQDVISHTTGQDVIPGTALKYIAARAAGQVVFSGTALQCVIAIAPEKVVMAFTTAQAVRAISANKNIIACSTIERIRAAAAGSTAASRACSASGPASLASSTRRRRKSGSGAATKR